MLAASAKFFESIHSTYHKRILEYNFLAKLLIPYQPYLYFIVNMFGRFLLYSLSWAFVLRNANPEARIMRNFEISGMAFYCIWYTALCYYFGSWQAILTFVIVSHVTSSILHLQINVSHYAMDTQDIDCSEHFAVKALRTTMDVDCPEWMDWFHGGLQFQVIHHLFPRMPRHNLRKAQKLVIKFALSSLCSLLLPIRLHQSVHSAPRHLCTPGTANECGSPFFFQHVDAPSDTIPTEAPLNVLGCPGTAALPSATERCLQLRRRDEQQRLMLHDLPAPPKLDAAPATLHT
jgi:hypothetical protein